MDRLNFLKSLWLGVAIVVIFFLVYYKAKVSNHEPFVVSQLIPFDHAPKDNDPLSQSETAFYPKKYEAIRDQSPNANLVFDDQKRPLAYQEVAQRGYPESEWLQPEGYRWKFGFRPYFWKNFPDPPVWLPPRPGGMCCNSEYPPDPELLKMMENAHGPRKGESPKGYRYLLPIERPVCSPICADFANKACKDQVDPHFCFNRAYAKCINGIE